MNGRVTSPKSVPNHLSLQITILPKKSLLSQALIIIMVLLYHALNIQTESEDQGLSGTPLFVILTSIFESKITVSNS